MITFSTRHAKEQLRQMPMAAILLSLVIGIVVSPLLQWHYGVWILLFILTGAAAFLLKGFILLFGICLGGFVQSINAPEPLHFSHPVEFIVKVSSEPVKRKGFNSATAKILMADGKKCSGKVLLTTDSLLTPQHGDIISARALLRDFSDQSNRYEQMMWRRGYLGGINISKHRCFAYFPTLDESLHHKAKRRLSKLLPDNEGKKIALAMTLGSKEYFDRDLRQSYSNVGVSHLLAVSGLHVGIVALLLNLLLLPLVLFWRGDRVKSVAIVVCIWIYVALCGYPISAIRAAIMFSTLQLSLNTRGVHSAANSLFLAAFIMLSIEPTALFDISFSLSFCAVAGIIFVGKPLCDMLRGENPIVNAISNSVVISVVCTLATMPIISEVFGVVSLLSIIVNPIVIFISQIVIILSFATLALPQSIAQFTAQAAGWCGTIQNKVVTFAGSFDVGYAQTQSDHITTITLYAIFFVAIIISLGCKRVEDV